MHLGKRILVAKPGLDGHDRGALFVARALVEAGYEVIYTGLHQTAEQIAAAAVHEDVDMIALSIMSGGEISIVERVVAATKETGAGAIPIIVGGVIPKQQRPALQDLGVQRIFGPGATSLEIIDFVRSYLSAHPSAERDWQSS